MRKHYVSYPTSGNIVAEAKFAFQEAKMFPKKFRNIFVAETMFPSLPTCCQMFPNVSSSRNIVFPFGHVKTLF